MDIKKTFNKMADIAVASAYLLPFGAAAGLVVNTIGTGPLTEAFGKGPVMAAAGLAAMVTGPLLAKTVNALDPVMQKFYNEDSSARTMMNGVMPVVAGVGALAGMVATLR